MTIKELLDSVKALRANTYTDDELTAWLNRLERNVWHNLVVTHARFDGLPEELPVYDALTDDETELMIPPLHDEIYIHYLCMQIDLYNNELIKYANSRALYNTAWNDLANWWNRNYLPVKRITFFNVDSGEDTYIDPLSST